MPTSEEFEKGFQAAQDAERGKLVALLFEQTIKATPEVAFVLGQIVADMGLKDRYSEYASRMASKRFSAPSTGPRP